MPSIKFYFSLIFLISHHLTESMFLLHHSHKSSQQWRDRGLVYFIIHWFHFNKHNWQLKTMCDYLLLSASVCEYFLGNRSSMTAHPASLRPPFHSQRHIISCREGQTWNLILTFLCVCADMDMKFLLASFTTLLSKETGKLQILLISFWFAWFVFL